MTGHDKVFNIRLIGELNTRNTNHRIKKVETNVIIELHISGFAKSIFIQKEYRSKTNKRAPQITILAIRFLIIFIICCTK